MPLAERYLISATSRERLKDPKLFAHIEEEGIDMKELLGFSDEAILGFYEAANKLFYDKRYQDAADAFFFLSHLAPQVKAFWLGQARCARCEHKLTEAIPLYLAALALDEGNKDITLESVRCCIAAEELDTAMNILDSAMTWAHDHLTVEGATDLHDTCVKGKEWIAAKLKKEE